MDLDRARIHVGGILCLVANLFVPSQGVYERETMLCAGDLSGCGKECTSLFGLKLATLP